MPAKMTPEQLGRQGLAIASRSAARDLIGVRETLLRLQHDWSPANQGIEGQFNALLNDLDNVADSIERLGSGAA